MASAAKKERKMCFLFSGVKRLRSVSAWSQTDAEARHDSENQHGELAHKISFLAAVRQQFVFSL
jgi:hypothetical protein